MNKLYFPLFLLVLLYACTNKPTVTGLQVFKDYDSTRLFDMNRAQGHRPVKIDLFYPATAKEGQHPLQYGDILDMYEERIDYNINPDSARSVSRQLSGAIASYLHLDSAEKLLSYKTGIYLDLPLPADKHPLIVYAASMNGSSWENAMLFDSLAQHGYVVAAVSSVGLYPGFMSGAQDMNEQVDDILYTVHKLKQYPFIDSSKVGLLSWSLGGTAATKAAMLENFKCLLSFDGTEIHYFGVDSAWDMEYQQIVNIPPYEPNRLTLPYMYLASDRQAVGPVDNLQAQAASKEKYYLQLKNTIHEDFSAITTIVDDLKHEQDSSSAPAVTKLTCTFFDQYLKGDAKADTKALIQQLVTQQPAKYSRELPK